MKAVSRSKPDNIFPQSKHCVKTQLMDGTVKTCVVIACMTMFSNNCLHASHQSTNRDDKGYWKQVLRGAHCFT
jgi:hypothetical protein